MKVHAATCAAVLVVNLLAVPAVTAATAGRLELVNAAGVCVPFTPTTQLRNSVGGVRNAGTATFYVVCSQQGDLSGGPTGTSGTVVYVRNSGPSDITINCTMRPGYSLDGSTTAGGAYPASVVVEPGTTTTMVWDAAVLGAPDARFMNPNFTCTLPVNGAISFIFTVFDEEIGT